MTFFASGERLIRDNRRVKLIGFVNAVGEYALELAARDFERLL